MVYRGRKEGRKPDAERRLVDRDHQTFQPCSHRLTDIGHPWLVCDKVLNKTAGNPATTRQFRRSHTIRAMHARSKCINHVTRVISSSEHTPPPPRIIPVELNSRATYTVAFQDLANLVIGDNNNNNFCSRQYYCSLTTEVQKNASE